MSTNAEIQRCVTCGSRVTIHASGEGTCSYEALDDADVTRLLAEVEQLRAALERIATERRPDGTYNLSREACEQIAREAVRAAVRG